MPDLSTLPFLFAAQAGFLLFASYRNSPASVPGSLVLIGGLTIWSVYSASLAIDGVYRSPDFLALYPGFLLPMIPFAVTGVLLALPIVRRGVWEFAGAVPAHWFVAIQALRVLALGTLIKTLMGGFPVHVELAIGLTDLAFGLSALWLYGRARDGRISSDALAIWHAVGIFVVALPGEIAIQTGLPGPMQIFTDAPTAEIMLEFPLVLGPSLVVPCFLMLNLLGILNTLRVRSHSAAV